MRRRAILAAAALLAASLGTVPGCGPGVSDVATAGASVVLITLDTTRADALGCYRGESDRTPSLDTLAARGVRFEEVRTVAPITLPSHASILTGHFPVEHGVRDNGTFQLGADAVTLAEVLAGHGYECAAVIASPVLNATHGLDQGFEVYRDAAAIGRSTSHPYRPATEVADDCLDWLAGREEPTRPFFLWAHFFDPHRPLHPPDRLAQKYLGGSAAAGSMSQIERERRLYAAEVAYMDEELGRLLEALDDSVSGAEDPIVVVVSDHGEGNGDHGELAHGYFLFETTVRVPLIVAHPSLPQGAVVKESVTLVDLYPTILELVGVTPDSNAGSSGVSLVALLQPGEQAWEPPPRPLYFETCLPYTNHRWSPMYGILGGGYKLIESARPQLFDLARDPHEERDLLQPGASGSEDVERVVRGLREGILAMRRRQQASSRRVPDAADRAALEALGYVAVGAAGVSDEVLAPGPVADDLRDPKDCLDRIRLHGRAATLRGEGMLSEATATMLDLLALEPDNPYYLEQAGGFLLEVQRDDEACECFEKAVALEPLLAISWRSLARLYRQRGDLERTVEALRQLLVADPSDQEARLALARLLTVEFQRYAEARALLESFLQRHAQDDDLARQIREQIETLEDLGQRP